MTRASSLSSLLANLAWERACRADAKAFRAALRDPDAAQNAVLQSVVRQNEGTEIGRSRWFSRIRSVAEFRARVPLSDYEDYAPRIDRIRRGEQGLLTEEPVERLVPTSGSTSGRKLIPFTASLRREFQSAVAPWIADLFARDMDLMHGPAYWAISPATAETCEPGGVPVGFEDDTQYLGWWSRRLVRHALAVPADVRHLTDVDTFRMATLLFLLRARTLRLVSVWHPSYLELLVRFMQERWNDLLRLLADGHRVSGMGDAASAILARRQPAMARELERADPSTPETVWPHLRAISCWADGQSAGAAATLRRLVPRARIEPKGLLATEAVVSIPFAGARPLAVTSHFLEFIDSNGNVCGASELSEGETYSVVVTTSGGLYRYRMHDLVRVEGFVARTPSIVFVGREDRISDLRGEKLSEAFVASVLETLFVERVPEFAMLAPEECDGAIRYALFVDEGPPVPDNAAVRLDGALSASPHYDWARKLGQIAPAVVVPVGTGAHAAFVSELARCGQSLGGIKPSCLRAETDWRRVLPVGRRRSFA